VVHISPRESVAFRTNRRPQHIHTQRHTLDVSGIEKSEVGKCAPVEDVGSAAEGRPRVHTSSRRGRTVTLLSASRIHQDPLPRGPGIGFPHHLRGALGVTATQAMPGLMLHFRSGGMPSRGVAGRRAGQRPAAGRRVPTQCQLVTERRISVSIFGKLPVVTDQVN
jgi:hypothetical protein